MRWGRRVEAGEASTFEDRIQGPLLSLGTQTFRVSSGYTALTPSYHVHPASGCSPGPAWRWPRGSCWRTAATSTASPSGSRGSRRPAPTSAWSSTKVRPGTWRLEPPVPPVSRHAPHPRCCPGAGVAPPPGPAPGPGPPAARPHHRARRARVHRAAAAAGAARPPLQAPQPDQARGGTVHLFMLLYLITRCVQKKYPPHPHALAQESDKQKLRFDLNPEIHSLKQ